MRGVVDPDVVRVLPEFDFPYRCKVGAPKQPHGAIGSVRNVESVRRFHIANALWLM